MEKAELPPLFEGATHRLNGVEPVKAVQWNKDGDHPKVSRYPIERRDAKGLLDAGENQFALRFGEWILEDSVGRLWVEAAQELPAKYVPESGGVTIAAVLALVAFGFVYAFLASLLGDATFVLGVTHLMYYSAIKGQWDNTTNGVFNLGAAGSTMKTSAHTNTYSPNQDTHDFFDDVTNEVTGTNYTAGGATLGSQTLTRSSGTVTFDANDVVWTQNAAGFSTGRKFVTYLSTGTASTSRLFSVVTADADVGNVTGDLTIQWSASGIATWTTT